MPGSSADGPAGSTRTTKRRAGLIVVALVAAAAVVALGAWAALAPVRQNSVRYVIPADAQVYVEVDLLALTGDEATRFIESVWSEVSDEGLTDQDDPISALDESFFDEMFGVTFTDDVSPWIGRHLAAAVFDIAPVTLNADPRGEDILFNEEVDGAGSLLVAADVRKPEMADEFLDDLADGFEREARRNGWDWAIDFTTIGGIRFQEATGIPEFAGWQAERMSVYFGRSDDVVLFATSKALIEDVLDVQSGSLPGVASSAEFIEALEESQAGAFLTAYADRRLAKEFLDAAAPEEEYARTARAVNWIALSALIVENELILASQINTDSGRLPDEATAWLESLNGKDPIDLSIDGYDSYLVLPSFDKMCLYDDSFCSSSQVLLGDIILSFLNGDNEVGLGLFASTDGLQAYVDDSPSLLEPYGDWQVSVNDYSAEVVEPDGVSYWYLSGELDTPDAAVEFVEASAKLGGSDSYLSARSALAESVTTIFYFDGNQYRRSGSTLMGPIVPETAIGGIVWDGITLRGDAIIRIDPERARIDAEDSPSRSVTDATNFGDPVVVGGSLPQMPTGIQSDSTATGVRIPSVFGSDFAGSAVTIEDDGRAKAIVFLAHWCGNCQEQVSDLRPWLVDGGIDDNVDIYSVVTASKPDGPNFPPSTWLETEGWTPPVIVDDKDNSVHAAFGGGGFPFWVFVNNDGSVASRFAGTATPEQLEQMLENLS